LRADKAVRRSAAVNMKMAGLLAGELDVDGDRCSPGRRRDMSHDDTKYLGEQKIRERIAGLS
jgi:hypothetical protein